MATVTVVTAERTLEIEATSIVDGSINSDGHLILTRHDDTPIDMGAVSGMKVNPGSGYVKADVFSYIGPSDPGSVPDGSVWYDTTDVSGPFASETQKGLIELATTAEATTGTDTQRAVTAAGVKAVGDTKQPLDTDLTAIAALAAANDDVIQRKAGVWATRTLAQFATDLATPLQYTAGAWVAYTPTWTSSGTAPALGNGVLVGRYNRTGRMITCEINMIPGTTTTYGTGTYSFALPVAAAAFGATPPGTAHLLGTARWGGQVPVASGQTTVAPFFPLGSGDCRLTNMTPTVPEAFANGSQLRMLFTYEAVS